MIHYLYELPVFLLFSFSCRRIRRLAGRVDERDQHYRRWWAGKVMTQARIALLTPFSPIGWTSQVSLEQSYRQIPADVRLRWDNETQRKGLEAYNLQRRQEKEAEVAQQAAEEAKRNNHSTAWIIWDEVGVFAEGGVSLFVDLVEGKPEVLKERANEVTDGMAGLIGMAVHPVQTYHQISEASSGQKTRMMTELALGFLPLKTKLPKLPFDMPKLNPGMEVAGADGMVYRIAEKDLPSPEKNGYMRSEGLPDHKTIKPIDPRGEPIKFVPNLAQEEIALKTYEKLRSTGLDADELAIFSRNTGLSFKEASNLKKHVLLTEHINLVDTINGEYYYKGYFDPYMDIAYGWEKALEGELSVEEKAWFRQLADHELDESKLMKEGLPYRDINEFKDGKTDESTKGAHELASKQPGPFPGFKPKV